MFGGGASANSFYWEQGQTVLGIGISLPAATTQIAVAAMLVVVLILRPDGLTAGRELRWPGRVRLAARGERRSAVRVSK